MGKVLNGTRFTMFRNMLRVLLVYPPSLDQESRYEALVPHRSLCGPRPLACLLALPSDPDKVLPSL